MASDREDAKSSIVTRESDDPELQEALSSAHKYQLEFAKEQHRHTEAMRGWSGRLLGPNESAPSMIAFIGMLLGLVVMIICLVAANNGASTAMEFWGKWAERALGFSATCIAFIFGKGIKA